MSTPMKLKRPVNVGDKTITELVFRGHSVARDYLAFDIPGGTAQRQALIASMADLDIAVVQALDGRDYQKAARYCDELIDADDAAIKAYLAALQKDGAHILAEKTKRLKEPLQFGKKTFNELTFRDHTIAGDYLAFDMRGGTLQRITLVAGIAGVDEEIVLKLHGLDYQIAIAHVDAMIEADEKEVFSDLPAGDAVKK